MMNFVLDKVENIAVKRRKCWLPAFSPFPTMFQRLFSEVIKRWVGVESGWLMNLYKVMAWLSQLHTMFSTLSESFGSIAPHYFSLDGFLKIPIYLVQACWVQNRCTFLLNNHYFEIQA